MKLPTLVMFLAYATAAAAMESPTTSTFDTRPRYVFKPLIEDYYPAASRDLAEEGTTRIKLCYDAPSRPLQVTVEDSSGFTRLDEAALRWGSAVRIRAGTFRGLPKPGCALVQVKFSLEKSRESPDQDEELLLPLVDEPPVLDSLPLPPPPYPGRFIPLGGKVGS